MARVLEIDASSFNKGAAELGRRVASNTLRILENVGDEIMRLSTFEVPHDKGLLQNSGSVERGPGPETVTVGYNKVYAARLHENPQFNFQKGRKGKYLEDPIKNNLRVFLDIIGRGFKVVIR